MNNTKNAIAITLFSCMSSGKKHYTCVRVNKIIELLSHIHNINVKRAWLFRCLRDLEDAGFIRRKKRWKRYDDGEFEQLSSLITFTLKGVRYLVAKRVAGAAALLKRMLNWLKKDDERWPKEEDILKPPTDEEIRKNKRRFAELIASLS